MHLFTQTLNTATNLLAEEESLSLNLDIFEANLVNLIILCVTIFKLGGPALTEGLETRQKNVVTSIQNSEERLQKAVTKLEDSEKNLAQVQLVIAELKENAVTTAKNVRSNIFIAGKIEIEAITAAAKRQVITIETRGRKEVSDYVVTEALKRATSIFEGKMKPIVQGQIIDQSISKISKLKLKG
jgi:F-type H+-transporting ATPase subunit b